MSDASKDVLFIEIIEKQGEVTSMTHAGKLVRIQSSDRSGFIRSDEVVGEFCLPILGSSFLMVAKRFDESLSDDYRRKVFTSEVLEILKIKDDCFEFQTRNSKYRLSDIKFIQR